MVFFYFEHSVTLSHSLTLCFILFVHILCCPPFISWRIKSSVYLYFWFTLRMCTFFFYCLMYFFIYYFISWMPNPIYIPIYLSKNLTIIMFICESPSLNEAFVSCFFFVICRMLFCYVLYEKGSTEGTGCSTQY